jgi:GNAT superfamily N-acetyltransferase
VLGCRARRRADGADREGLRKAPPRSYTLANGCNGHGSQDHHVALLAFLPRLVLLGRSLGVVALAPDDAPGTLDLNKLSIEPRHIRGGVGRALLAQAIAEVRRRGAERLTILANPNAAGFYERTGAVRVSEAPSDFCACCRSLRSGSIPGRRPLDHFWICRQGNARGHGHPVTSGQVGEPTDSFRMGEAYLLRHPHRARVLGHSVYVAAEMAASAGFPDQANKFPDGPI